MNLSQNQPWRYLAQVAALTVVYLGIAQLSHSIAGGNQLVLPAWALAGISQAAVFLLGRGIFLGILLGELFRTLAVVGLPWIVACGMALGCTLQAVIGAELLSAIKVHPSLKKLRDVGGFIALAVVLSTLISPTIGLISLYLEGQFYDGDWLLIGGIWWWQQVMGVLLVTPVLLTWFAPYIGDWGLGELEQGDTSEPTVNYQEILLENTTLDNRFLFAVWLLLLVTVSWVAFRLEIPQATIFQYLSFSLIVWAAVQFGQRGATLGGLILSSIAIGQYMSSTSSIGEEVLVMGNLRALPVTFLTGSAATQLQTLLVVVAATVLILAAAITERTSVNNLLSLGEEKYRHIFENAVEGIFQSTLDGRFIRANLALANIYGYQSPEELIANLQNVTHQLYVNPQDRVKLAQLLVQQEIVSGFESQKRRQDGTVIWTAESLRLVRNHYGEPLYYEGTVTDITLAKQAQEALCENEERFRMIVEERTAVLKASNRQLLQEVVEHKRIEQALRDSERRFRAIFDRTFHGIGILSPEGIILEVNQTALNFSNIEAAEIVGNLFWEAQIWRTSPEIQERLKKAVAAAAKGELVLFDIDIPSAGDTISTIDFSLKPVLDDQGQIVLLICECRDITERKQAEEKLKASQQRLSLLVQQTPLAVIEWNTKGEIVDWNPAAEAIFGYNKEEALGHTAKLIVSEETIADKTRLLDKFWLDKEVTRTTKENQTKDGRVMICEWYNSPLIDAQGNLLGAASMVLDVTERAKTQEALRESEERFALAIQANNSGLFDLNFKTENYYYSPQFLSQIDYSLDEPRPTFQELSSLVHPEDWDLVKATLDEIFTQLIFPSWNLKFRLLLKDGSTRWILSQGLVIRGAQGKVSRLIGTHTDVSDAHQQAAQRQQAEAALREREEQFSQLAENIREVFFLTTPDSHQVLYISPAYEQIWGRTTQSLYERPESWLEAVHPDDSDRIIAAYATSLQEKRDLDEEYRIVQPDGSERWVGVRSSFVFNEAGEPKSIAGIAEDITERKLSEAELHRQARRRQLFAEITLKIRRSLKLEKILQTTVTEVRRILNVDRVVIYQLEPDGSGTVVNEAVLPNWPAIQGQDINDPCFTQSYLQRYRQGRIHTIADLQQSEFKACYREMLSKFGVRANLVVPILRREELWGLLIAHQCSEPRQWQDFETELLDQLADQVGIAIAQSQLLEKETKTAEQLTEQNLRLEEARREAEAANRAKSEFLANMSHELRTPLNGILGYAQILKLQSSLNTKQREQVNIIQQSGEHLLTLLNDILDLSKIEAGKMELCLSNFHLPNFLEGIAEIIRLSAEQKNIAFYYEVLSELPLYVNGDEKRLRQVLINLLGNAVKFTDTGKITFKVGYTTPINNQQPKMRFQVEDTGIGIAPEKLAEIFLPFHQIGDSNHRFEGTGLGLAISQKLVKLMESELQVKSSIGQGSVFWIDLDLPEVSQGQEILSVPGKKIVGFRGYKRKLLIADDKWENRSVLVNLLLPLGFEIAEVKDGKDCLNQAVIFKPDLILLDMIMPVIDGLETTRQLRRLKTLKDVVIIATSASVFDYNRQEYLAAGCDGFIPKPVQAENLFELLQAYLGIEWIYEDSKAVTNQEITEATVTPRQNLQGETPQSIQSKESTLVVPPSTEIASLYELAMMGDIGGIIEQANKIEQLDEKFVPFAHKLLQLAKGFQEKQILEFVKQYFIN
ncbi:MAG: PAS domain S-box protein [Symploca sp. SIO2G7]|nr:PAS domain S-box protein [Symploca sp. SIO2G7]